MKNIILLSLTLSILLGCSKDRGSAPEVKEPVCLVSDVKRYRYDSSNDLKERYRLTIDYDSKQRPASVLAVLNGEKTTLLLEYTDEQIKLRIDDPNLSNFGVNYFLNEDNLIERAENIQHDLVFIYSYNDSRQLVKMEAFDKDDPSGFVIQDLTYNSFGIDQINISMAGNQSHTVSFGYNTTVPYAPIQYHEGYFPHLEHMAAVMYDAPLVNIIEILYHLGYFGQIPKYAVKDITFDGTKVPDSMFHIVEDGNVSEISFGRERTTFDYKCN